MNGERSTRREAGRYRGCRHRTGEGDLGGGSVSAGGPILTRGAASTAVGRRLGTSAAFLPTVRMPRSLLPPPGDGAAFPLPSVVRDGTRVSSRNGP